MIGMRHRLREMFLLAGFLALFALPAFARTDAGDHCEHNAAPHGEIHAAHHHDDAAIEEVPFGGAAPQAPCPQHSTPACKESMTLKCSMMSGCCIKADGPLSTGLNDRPATDNDLVLNDHPALPPAGQMAGAVPCQWILPQDRTEPDPRPPSA